MKSKTSAFVIWLATKSQCVAFKCAASLLTLGQLRFDRCGPPQPPISGPCYENEMSTMCVHTRALSIHTSDGVWEAENKYWML